MFEVLLAIVSCAVSRRGPDAMEEALRDAITWLEGQGPEAATAPIGLEVSTRSGEWSTIRLPHLLLCPLTAA